MEEDIKEERSHADKGGKHGNHDVVEDMDDLWVKQMEADKGGKHGNHDVVEDMDDLWVKQMEAKLAYKFEQCQPSHPFTICKVPRDIRRVDDVAHDPLVVSIGPYCHVLQNKNWKKT
ncbi:hypothetical protein AAC387_Pa03g2225 [Persea americana]